MNPFIELLPVFVPIAIVVLIFFLMAKSEYFNRPNLTPNDLMFRVGIFALTGMAMIVIVKVLTAIGVL